MGNLPLRMSSFVGRDNEVAELAARVVHDRIVTLVGPGGSGKSSLAVEAGRRANEAFDDGVWSVELQAANTEVDIADELSDVLGLQSMPGAGSIDLLAQHLEPASMLILLDNCDWITDEAARFVSRLLRRCDGLRFLATSRSRLGAKGEVQWKMTGLSHRSPPGYDLLANLPPALELFVERAQAHDQNFSITPSNADAVLEICRRVDGLPLAIELAAGRIATFGPQDVLDRLIDSNSFLVATSVDGDRRHASVDDMIAVAFEGMEKPEQKIFVQLAVFNGGFDLEMAWRVTGDALDREDFERRFEALVDESMVARISTTPTVRFRLLETLRAFASLRLGDEPTVATVARTRHGDQLARQAEASFHDLWGPNQIQALDRLELDHDNFRAALRWFLESGDREGAQRLTGSLSRMWDLRGHYDEGLDWSRRALEPGVVENESGLWALNGLLTMAVLNGNVELALDVAHEAIELGRKLEHDAGLAHALQYLGLCHVYVEHPDARGVLAESIQVAVRAEAPHLAGLSHLFLTAIEYTAGNIDKTLEHSLQARELFTAANEAEGLGFSFIGEATVLWRRGDLGGSALALQSAFDCFRPLQASWVSATAGSVAAAVWAKLGHHEEAARVTAMSERLREDAGAVHVPFVAGLVDQVRETCNRALDRDVFEQVWSEGHATSPFLVIDELIESVQQLIRTASSTKRAPMHETTAQLVDEGGIWFISYNHDRLNVSDEGRITDRKGLHYLRELLAHPGREYKALDLSTASNPTGPLIGVSAELTVSDGDLGPASDVQSLKAYGHRLRELEGEIDEAEQANDLGQLERLRTEQQMLVKMIDDEFGYRGKPRPSGDSEKARTAVRNAVNRAISAIRDISPTLAEHLNESVVRRQHCTYEPRSEVSWRFEHQ